MTITETQIHETEDDRVARWRRDQLVRAGYDEPDALLLADLPHVDLHTALELLQNGCARETAVRILI